MNTDTEPTAEPTAETPEVVQPTVAAVEPAPEQQHASAAITAAANAAMNNPGAPGAAEFMALAAQARIISLSGAAPKAIRENPYIAFHVALIGRDFGLSVAAAAELVDVIESGGQPRISLSPQLLNGQIRRLGLGSIIPVQRTPEVCVAAALGPDGEYDERCKAMYPEHRDDCRCRGVLGTSTFTWDDARMAGLVGSECQPGEHVKNVNRSKNGSSYKVCGCNQGYITYPARMLWWRAGGFAGDDYFPEASLGLYAPEALGVAVDDEGRPIDVASVPLPDGYEPAPDPRKEREEQRARELEEPMTDLDLLDLQIRIQALPPEQRKLLGEKWKEHERLSKYRLESVPAALHRLAAALVTGVEAAARSATKDHDQPWDQRTARAVIVSSLQALVPQDGPDEDGGAPAPADANGEPVAPEDGAGTAPDGLPAEPEFDLDNDDQADGPSDRPSSPKDDPALPAALARMDALNPPQEMIDRLSAAVKAMHHTEVNRVITDHGGAAEGHIDTRRVLACSYLISDEMGASTDGSS